MLTKSVLIRSYPLGIASASSRDGESEQNQSALIQNWPRISRFLIHLSRTLHYTTQHHAAVASQFVGDSRRHICRDSRQISLAAACVQPFMPEPGIFQHQAVVEPFCSSAGGVLCKAHKSLGNAPNCWPPPTRRYFWRMPMHLEKLNNCNTTTGRQFFFCPMIISLKRKMHFVFDGLTF